MNSHGLITECDSDSAKAADETGLRRNACHRPEAIATIAGPLCFAGDIIARSICLPRPIEGDHLVVHDAGANTFALFSRHCSRQAPPVYVFASRDESSGRDCRILCVKEVEPEESVLKFWG